MATRMGVGIGLLLMATPAFAVNCGTRDGIGDPHAGACGFNLVSRSFAGSAEAQARCLTRHVNEGGTIGAEDLPASLAALVGRPTGLSLTTLRAFLSRAKVAEADVGGPIVRGLRAEYLIIHDTSSPNCSVSAGGGCGRRGEFPSDRDDASWVGNRTFNGYKGTKRAIAHVMTNRVGESITMADLSTPVATTKFEVCADASRKVGLFVGVENVQPRIGRPAIPSAGKRLNDILAPTPGFTRKQYERLALVYVVASARHGRWLVPAFHAVLDQMYRDGHDDPQHFDAAEFGDAVARVLAEIGAA